MDKVTAIYAKFDHKMIYSIEKSGKSRFCAYFKFFINYVQYYI